MSNPKDHDRSNFKYHKSSDRQKTSHGNGCDNNGCRISKEVEHKHLRFEFRPVTAFVKAQILCFWTGSACSAARYLALTSIKPIANLDFLHPRVA
jgi:hypothetical protein